MTHIATCGLGFRYPAQERWALDSIDLDFAPGEVTWVNGALGSGTSTLLLALAGLAPRLTGGERRGTVVVDDADPADLAPLAARIAYLGPSPAVQVSGVANHVLGEVALGPMNLGWDRDRALAAADGALGALGVTHLAQRDPGALSGGETQRVLLAALLASDPAVWLLDEPFSALDRSATERVQQLLRDWAHAGATVIIACDNADLMLPVADRLIVFRDGQVELDGSPPLLLAGDAVLKFGAGTTDAADLATRAGFAAPRPLTSDALVDRVEADPPRVTAREHAGNRPASPGGSVALRFDDVAFSYQTGRLVLDHVGVEISPGEAVGLFGANGAGKSTLLRLAMALEHPRSGSVTTLGRVTARMHPEDLAPQVAFLFQSPERQLFAGSVQGECSLAPKLAGCDPRQAADRVARTLAELGLADTAEQHPYDLPLPRRRLVALAAVLSADPDLLLLDEPTAALDNTSRNLVIDVVRKRIGLGKTVLAITHDPVFAHEALDRGVVLDGGRIVQDDTVRAVIDGRRLARPAALMVAVSLGLGPGEDRRNDVAQLLRTR
ncbi:MAG TPA: ATP-binding cassette domain-containing protein [Gemmatimonadales bacterium]|jgi:energy-coupling factor transport system ATP-binding protein